MVAAYVLAALLDRDFKLDFTVPCPLVSLLRPNKVDWRVERSELDRPKVQRVHLVDKGAHVYFESLQNHPNLDDVFPANVTLLKTNMDVVQFLRLHPLAARVPWLYNQRVEDVYRRVLTDLFVPTPELQDVVDRVKAAVPAGKQLVCAHMRIGRDMNAVAKDSRRFHYHYQFSVLASFLARYSDPSRYRIVVISDSHKILEKAKEHFPNITIPPVPGPLVHIELTPNANLCDGFKRDIITLTNAVDRQLELFDRQGVLPPLLDLQALAEQLILSTCEVLVQSESGFSRVAGFLRGRDDLLYVFRDDVLPCRRQDSYLNTDMF